MFLIGAARVGGHADRSVGGFHEVVAEQVIFDFLAGDIGEHHAVDFDAGREGLAGLLHHFRIIRAVVDDIDVLKREVVLAHDGADTVGPPTGGLEIGFDLHSVNVEGDRSGAR